ncbi:hypothetical protein GGP91_003065 [Salinibacter ruber]|nr:hypothetical protein [Salinibacter ruber]
MFCCRSQLRLVGEKKPPTDLRQKALFIEVRIGNLVDLFGIQQILLNRFAVDLNVLEGIAASLAFC